ncbi:hypothetical protein GCM10009753_76400 [Streptantibioticus ferralitis]
MAWQGNRKVPVDKGKSLVPQGVLAEQNPTGLGETEEGTHGDHPVRRGADGAAEVVAVMLSGWAGFNETSIDEVAAVLDLAEALPKGAHQVIRVGESGVGLAAASQR